MVGIDFYPTWPIVVFVLFIFGAGFGSGYGCASCDGHPSITWVKKK